MSQIIVFWSNREIKMPRSVVFRLNSKTKMPRNSKVVQRNGEFKMPQKFLVLKYLIIISRKPSLI